MRFKEFIHTYKVRRDGWDADYGSSLNLTEDAVSQEKIQPFVEIPSQDWQAIAPSQELSRTLADLSPFRVVDGTRRLHQRLVLEQGGQFYYGGMGTIAVGALEITPGRPQSLQQALISRIVERYALFGGVDATFNEVLHIPGVPSGFHAERIQVENTPKAPLDTLHRCMRKAEDALVNTLHQKLKGGLILVDGPLQYHRFSASARVVGYVKTQHTRYLPPELHEQLSSLRPGERTPVFQIGQDSLSWYQNLGKVSLVDNPLQGVVRLEMITDGSSNHFAEVILLANHLQTLLPILATQKHQDPRAPQNLIPIQALENALRRQMGEERLIQRRIEHYLYQTLKEEALS